MTDLGTHRRHIATALQALEKSLDRLIDALAHRPWLTVDGATDDRDALRRVCEAYRKIDYDMEDEVNETLDCLGVVGVSSEVLTRAEQVNEAKAELKRVCLPLSRLRTRVPRKATKDAAESAGEGADTEMIQTTRAVLRTLQRSDLNLTAAYRKIPMLGAPPRSITYVRASTRAVYRKTIAELETLLMSAEGPAAAKDRARLAALSPRETHLALVQEHYTNIRANVVYERRPRPRPRPGRGGTASGLCTRPTPATARSDLSERSVRSGRDSPPPRPPVEARAQSLPSLIARVPLCPIPLTG